MANHRNHLSNIEVARELLSPYLDNEVTGEERVLVEQTLATSPELSQELEALRLTIAQLTALPRLSAPRPFTLSEVDVQPTRAKSGRFFGFPVWFGGLATVAATLVCLFVLSWVMIGQRWSNEGTAEDVAQFSQATGEIANAPAAASTAQEQTEVVDEEEAMEESQEADVITSAKVVTEAEVPADVVAAEAAPAGEAAGQPASPQPETQALMQSSADDSSSGEVASDTLTEKATATSTLPGTRTVLTEAAVQDEAPQNEAARLEAAASPTSSTPPLASPPQTATSTEYSVPRRPLWFILLGGIALATLIATGLIGWFIFQNKRH
jgi:hypothetical protein